jgi:uncharacterized membrane protein YedE/YeeE
MTEFTPWSALVGGVFIGLAAVFLMVTTGRVAGVSGFVSRLLPPYNDGDLIVRLAFIAGLIAAPPLYVAATQNTIDMHVTTDVPLLVTAGLLVGIGSVQGSGCTSGHGVCGTARLSPRSLAATGVFMTAALLTVFVVRHVVGG